MQRMKLGINLSLNDVRPTSNGMWEVTRTIYGDEISFSGPVRSQVLEQAQAHFNRVIARHNTPEGR